MLEILPLIISLATSPSALNNVSSSADDINVKKATTRTELAAAYYTEKQYGQALTELETALASSPNYYPALNMLGVVNMELKRNEAAEKSFRKALSIDNTNPETNNNFGWFLCQTNRIKDSYEYFDKASTNPSYKSPAKSLYNAGKCAILEGDDQKAMNFFIEALKNDPNATVVLLEIGNLYLKNNNLDASAAVVDQITEIEGLSPQVLWLGIKTEKARNNLSEVESYGLQLVKNFPQSPETVMWKAKAFN